MLFVTANKNLKPNLSKTAAAATLPSLTPKMTMKKTLLLITPMLLLASLLLGSLAHAAPVPAPHAPAGVTGQWDRIWRGTGALFAFDCTSAETCYAAGEDGLILKTTDTGQSWHQELISQGPNLYSLSAQQDLILAVGAGGAVFRSNNAGLTWQRISTPTSVDLRAVSLLPQGQAWAAGAGGVILHSNDGGQSWTAQNSNTIKNLNAIQFVNATTGYAAGDKGTLVKTTDAGATWTLQSNTYPSWARINTLFFSDANTGWLAGQAGYIRKTSDGGQSWQEITSNAGIDIFTIHFQGTRGIFGGAKGVIATSSDGETWEIKTSVPQNTRDVTAVFAHGVSDFWAIGMDKDGSARGWFIDKRAYGTEFEPVAGDYGPRPILNEVTLPEKNIAYVVGAQGAIGKTSDGGETWSWQHFKSKYSDSATIAAISCADANTCWIVGQVRNNPGFLYVTRDGGQTWEFQSPPGSAHWPWLYDVAMLDAQNGHAGANPNMYYTTDGGTTWKQSSVVGSTANVEISMASQYEGWTAQRRQGHRYTTSAGQSWKRYMNYDIQNNVYFFGVSTLDVNHDGGLDMGWLVGCQGPLVDEQCPADSGVIFYATGHEDAGAPQVLPANTPELYTIFMQDALHGWVGGAEGTMLYTENGGMSWQKIAVPTVQLITELAFYQDKMGFATTYSGEILRFRGPGRKLSSYTQTTSITIDGDINDWHYGGGMMLDADNASTVLGEKPYPDAESFSGTFYSRWMTDTLYLMAQVKDDVVGADDTVSFAVDGLNDDIPGNADDHVIKIAADGAFEGDASIAHAVSLTDAGWQLELGIPANLLGRTALAQNDAVGMNLMLEDGDGPGVSHSLLMEGRSLNVSPAIWGDIALLGNTLTMQEGVNKYKGTSDTFITRWGEDGKTTHGDEDTLSVVSSSGQKYSNTLLRFDLAALPQGAETGAANLALLISTTYAREGFQVTAYRLLRAWDEATATWFNADASTRWDELGALQPNVDYDPTPLDTVAIPTGFHKEWLSWDVTSAMQHWRAHPDENYGVILMGTNSSQTMNAYSSEFTGNQAERPKLSVAFTLQPRPTSTPTTKYLYLPMMQH